MDVKRPSASMTYTRQTRHSRWKILAGPLASLLLLYTFLPHCRIRLWPIRRHGLPLVTYEGESVSWERCGEITGHPLECSNLTVPMDHFAPDISSGTNGNHQTFVNPLMRLRGKNATQNVIINPGGPGGSGLAFIDEIGQAINTILGEGYHVLSFDPRGVGGSVPKAQCYPDEALRRAQARPRYAELSRSGEMYAWNKNLARACYDTMGEHAKYSG